MSSPLNLNTSPVGKSKLNQYQVIDSVRVQSIFGLDQNSNSTQFSPFPGVNNANSGKKDGLITQQITPSNFHGDDANDVSIDSIVAYTSDIPAMKLTYADFAYLKNVGVYPNNRLIVARRFRSGVHSDLSSVTETPMATLVSWVPEGTEWIKAAFGEEWTQAEASFTSILNNVGSEMPSLLGGSNLGNAAASGFGALPFPGFMEGIQYEVLRRLGVTEGFGIGNSPLGNPNLIREAMIRKTLDKNQSGSGLTCKISVAMEVEYEQKFIDGLDPSLVYLDIIQNALTFGTSESYFQFNTKFESKTSDFIKNLIKGDLKSIGTAIVDFVQALLGAIADIGRQIVNKLVNSVTNIAGSVQSPDSIFSNVEKAFASTIGHVVSKYKVKLIGVINSLTGTPSAPWHVTIGNPKKPLFCSGDMLVTSVELTLGKNLSFNDLPSSIKLSFTLASARNLGGQEIFQRFNTGRGRSYARLKESYVEKNISVGLTSSSRFAELGQQSKFSYSKTKDPVTGQTISSVSSLSVQESVDSAKSDPFYGIGSSTGMWFGSDSGGPGNLYGDPVTNPKIQETGNVQPSLSSNPTVPGTSVNLTQAPAVPSVQSSPTPGYVSGNWIGGQVLNSGSYNQEKVRINWSVSSSLQENTYVGRWDTSEGGNNQTSDSDYDILTTYVKSEASKEFDLTLQSKGLTKI